MANLLASLSTSGSALTAVHRALGTVQNNIANASTPGFATQRLDLYSQAFDVVTNLSGGVSAGELQSARDEYAEDAVRRQLHALGRYEAQADGAGEIEVLFDISEGGGVSGALDNLFSAFSAWSVAPNSTAVRQQVLLTAGALADRVRGLVRGVEDASNALDGRIRRTVDQINDLTAQIRRYNIDRLRLSEPDPGLDADIHTVLEQLATLVDFTAAFDANGTVTVLLAGGAPLAVGEHRFTLSADAGASGSPAPPSVRIKSSEGTDVSAQISAGQLGGLLDTRNRLIPSILGDADETGSLNGFVQGLADKINAILQDGFVNSESGAPHGAALFTYDAASPTLAAAGFRVNPALTADRLAAVDAAGMPGGNALALASLASPTSDTQKIDGMSFGDFFSQIAAAAGRESASAKNGATSQRQIVAAVSSLRNQISGVSLDEQAILLLEFQRAYEANARVLTVLNDLLETTINLIR